MKSLVETTGEIIVHTGCPKKQYPTPVQGGVYPVYISITHKNSDPKEPKFVTFLMYLLGIPITFFRPTKISKNEFSAFLPSM